MSEKLYINTKDESPRVFESDFLDFFSRVPYYVPLIIYIPVVIYSSYVAFMFDNTSLPKYLIGFFAGILMWSLAEYLLHRFLFHSEPKNKIIKRLHWYFHGIHHDYPQDSMRLVMPPPISLPLAILFYFSFLFIFNLLGLYQYFHAYFAGFVSAYLIYDMMHYASHHLPLKGSYLKSVKDHHMKHHYQDPNEGFGFTSKFWDIIFGTNFKDDKQNK